MTSDDHGSLLSVARKSLARSRLPHAKRQAALAELEELAGIVEFMMGQRLDRPAKAKYTGRRKRGKSA